MKSNRIKLSAVLVVLMMLSLSLTGCFHLRGKRPLPANLHTIYIDSSAPYSKITIQLKQVMRSLGIVLVDAPEDAPITLHLFNQKFKSRTLSAGATATTKEYMLRFSIDYELKNTEGDVVYGPIAIQTERNFMVLQDEVLSSSNEQAVLKQDMERDVMYQLINQLSSEDVVAVLDDLEQQ